MQRRGVVFQGSLPWGEALCADSREGLLLLAPVRREAGKPLEAGRLTRFRVPDASGILEVSGTLLGTGSLDLNGVPHEVLCLSVGEGAVVRLNRREHYRVAVALKGEIHSASLRELPRGLAAVFHGGSAEGAWPGLEDVLACRGLPCLVRDLSLGGARLGALVPGPKISDVGFLSVRLGPEPDESVRGIPCVFLQCRGAAFSSPFDVLVRVRFLGFPPGLEARLSRHLTRVQLETLRKGVKVD